MSKYKATFEIQVSDGTKMNVNDDENKDGEFIEISKITKDKDGTLASTISIFDADEYRCMMEALEYLGEKLDWRNP